MVVQSQFIEMFGSCPATSPLGEVVELMDDKRKPINDSVRQGMKTGELYPYYGATGQVDLINEYLTDETLLCIAEDCGNYNAGDESSYIITGKAWVNNHAHILGYNGKCPLQLLGFILNHLNISPYVTGCAQPKLNQDNLRRITIKLPENVDEVSSILSSLDSKIECNRKICANLEAQAQALFKHWFIDFVPFKDGKFVESELGMIPEGWRVVSLTSIATFMNGLAMQKFPPTEKDNSYPVLKIKELGQGMCDDSSDRCSMDIKKEYIIKNGDVIFSWSGTLLVDIWCQEIQYHRI